VNAYLPQDPAVVGPVAAVLGATLLFGLALTRLRPALARGPAWVLTAAGTVAVEHLTAAEPAGFRMVVLIVGLLWGLKAVVSVESQAQGQPRLTPGRWLAFATLWPGMRPALFVTAGGPARSRAGRLFASGTRSLALGVVLCGLARLAWVSFCAERGPRLLATALLLPGLSLVVHFGLFNLVAGAWRRMGVDCRPLFQAPLRSTSLAEFWGRRWNLAFSEMTARVVYRPLVERVGKGGATFGAFLLSGLLHELAISVPVQAGYGLPMRYFTLHGLLVVIEGRLARAGRPVDRPAWRGRLWTLAWLVLPLPVLFHLPFLRGVIWPLIGMGPDGG
jgi:alginate O-acetyltransferase complex protein AlgI